MAAVCGTVLYPTGSRCVCLYAPLDFMSNVTTHMVVRGVINNIVDSVVLHTAAALNTVT